MHDKEIIRFHVSDGVTYVSGLGFILPNNTQNIIRHLRGLSHIICLCLLLFFFCQRFFIAPSTYFAYFLGFDIKINQLTGMIVSSPISEQVILFFTNFASFIVCTGLVWVLTLRNFKFHLAFGRPNQGSLSVALPVIISTGILGESLGYCFGKGCRALGLLLTPLTDYTIGNHFSNNIIKIIITVFIVILQEVLFRGAILFTLRRYGDGFAIIASSILFSIFQNGILEIISSFFLGLVLGYFTIRSSSVHTAILGHVCLILTLFGFNWVKHLLEPSLANVIVNLSCIILLSCAGFAFISFSHRDKNAFVLKEPDGNLSLRRRLISFFCTLSFILLGIVVFFNIIDCIQIIG